MANLKDKIWKQRTIGQIWGRFALAGSQIAIFVSAFTYLGVWISAYTPIAAWLMERGVNLPFWVFMAIIIFPIIVAYFVAWKLLVATFYRSSTQQFWEQSKEWTDKINKMEKMLEELLAREKNP